MQPGPTKIAFLSIFPPTVNGIGDYTHDLILACIRRDPETEYMILASRDDGEADTGVTVDRCCSFHGDWVKDALSAVDRNRPDLVHLQHGYYMGRDGRVPAFLGGLAQRGVASVVTLHAVYPDRRRRLDSPLRWSPPRFHHTVACLADRVVIHQSAGAMEHLVRCGAPAGKISVIPHGTAEADPAGPAGPATARRDLGLPEGIPIVLSLGFIQLGKGVGTVVRAFDQVARDVPGAILVVAGRPEPNFPNPQYVWWLRRLMRRGMEEGWIDFRPGYLPLHLIPSYLAAADLVVFPYRQRQGAASGMFHRALSAGRPILASRLPKFEEMREFLGSDAPHAFAAPGSPSEWARSIVRLLKDTPLRERLSQRSAEVGRRTSWPVVADRHQALYRRILLGEGTDARNPGPGVTAG